MPTDFMEQRDARRSDRFTQFAVASAVEAADQAGWASAVPVDPEPHRRHDRLGYRRDRDARDAAQGPAGARAVEDEPVHDPVADDQRRVRVGGDALRVAGAELRGRVGMRDRCAFDRRGRADDRDAAVPTR